MKTRLIPFLALTALLIPGTQLSTLRAGQFDLPIPVASRTFGTNVTLLPNGNFVVTDPLGGPLFAVAGGAVQLYDGVTLALISTLTGNLDNDRVGSGGIAVLSNGNYVVSSPNWGFNSGAVTWCSATTGMTGIVSAANSLTGTRSSGVTALNNGNYVVRSPNRPNGTATNAGAVTWGNGTTGVSGLISATNSLIGGSTNDQVGSGGITVLTNGNFVVSSTFWNGARGAATWGSGTTAAVGEESDKRFVHNHDRSSESDRPDQLQPLPHDCAADHDQRPGRVGVSIQSDRQRRVLSAAIKVSPGIFDF